MWLCDCTNVHRLALICANGRPRGMLHWSVWGYIGVPVLLKVPRLAAVGYVVFSVTARPALEPLTLPSLDLTSASS